MSGKSQVKKVTQKPFELVRIPDSKDCGGEGIDATLRDKIAKGLAALKSEFQNGGAALLPWTKLGEEIGPGLSSGPGGCVMPHAVNVGRLLLEDSEETTSFRDDIGERFLKEAFPCVLPFRNTAGICFSGENDILVTQAQLFVLRLLLSIHPNFIKFTLVDTNTMGRAMKLLSPLRSVLNFSVIVADDQLESFLSALQDEVMEKNTTALSKYDWLWQYDEANPAAAEPYRIVLFSSGKKGVGLKSAQLLKQLTTQGNAARAGIYFVFCDASDDGSDSSDADPDESNGVKIDAAWKFCQREMGHVVVEKKKTEAYKDGWIDTRDGGAFAEFRLECPNPTRDDVERVQKKIVEFGKSQIKEIVRANIPEDDWWTKNSGLGLLVPIGLQSGADVQYFSLGNGGIVHNALVGGSVGTGKTILLHDLILNAARLYSPSELRMHLLDYKEGTEFACYKDLPHLENLSIGPNVEFGLDVLNGLSEEIADRAKRFKAVGVSNVGEYRKKTGETMPRHLVVIDEFQVLWADPVCGEQASAKMEDLVRRGRSFGINFILSTQSLRGANLSAAAKESLGLRICLRLSESDCEDFLSPGNMVAAGFTKAGEAVYNERGGLPDGNRLFRSAYLSGSEIVSLIRQLADKARRQKLATSRPNVYENDEFVSASELVKTAGPGLLCLGRTKGLRPVVAALPIAGAGFRAMAVVGGSKDKRNAIFAATEQQLSDLGISWKSLQDGSLKDETDRWRRWNEGEEPIENCPGAYLVRTLDRLRDARDMDVQAAFGGMLAGAPAGASSLLVLEAANLNDLATALNGADKSVFVGVLALDEDGVFGVSSKNVSLGATEGWWIGPSMEEGRKVVLATNDL